MVDGPSGLAYFEGAGPERNPRTPPPRGQGGDPPPGRGSCRSTRFCPWRAPRVRPLAAGARRRTQDGWLNVGYREHVAALPEPLARLRARSEARDGSPDAPMHPGVLAHAAGPDSLRRPRHARAQSPGRGRGGLGVGARGGCQSRAAGASGGAALARAVVLPRAAAAGAAEQRVSRRRWRTPGTLALSVRRWGPPPRRPVVERYGPGSASRGCSRTRMGAGPPRGVTRVRRCCARRSPRCGRSPESRRRCARCAWIPTRVCPSDGSCSRR